MTIKYKNTSNTNINTKHSIHSNIQYKTFITFNTKLLKLLASSENENAYFN